MPRVVSSQYIVVFSAVDTSPFSTKISIGALGPKATHLILPWDLFEGQPLIKLFNYFVQHQYLPKTGQDARTVTLAFKCDVSGLFQEVGPRPLTMN